MNFLKIAFCNLLLFLIFACSNPKVSYHYPNNQDVQRKSKAGNFMGNSWNPFIDKKDSKKGEKRPIHDSSALWQTSVQVVGLLFPISIIDEKSGIIATEWYQENPTSNSRIKINILIRDEESLDDSIRVSVFEQKRKDENSSWQGGVHNPKSVERSAMKADKIKNEILRRMKQINENDGK